MASRIVALRVHNTRQWRLALKVFWVLFSNSRLSEVANRYPAWHFELSSCAGRLELIAHVDVLKAVEILRALVEGDKDLWRIYSWKDQAMLILASAMNSNEDTQSEARAVINLLGSKNFVEFGKLLNR